jgi:uncharacterized protein (TIGR03067 family)
MPMRILIAALAAISPVAADKPADDVKKEMARLEGEWPMVSVERDGQQIPQDFRKQFKRVAKDDQTSVTVGGQTFMKANFSVDPTKKPKTIDYVLLEGPDRGKKQLGIYELLRYAQGLLWRPGPGTADGLRREEEERPNLERLEKDRALRWPN